MVFLFDLDVYTVCHKTYELTFVHIFAKYWPILKIFYYRTLHFLQANTGVWVVWAVVNNQFSRRGSPGNSQ